MSNIEPYFRYKAFGKLEVYPDEKFKDYSRVIYSGNTGLL